MVTGSADRVAPADLARTLYAAAGEPKEFRLIAEAGHGGYADVDSTYLSGLTEFFAHALPAAQPHAPELLAPIIK
jgi:fermentation-respiration switch protein FrsA (DUF1100 family)